MGKAVFCKGRRAPYGPIAPAPGSPGHAPEVHAGNMAAAAGSLWTLCSLCRLLLFLSQLYILSGGGEFEAGGFRQLGGGRVRGAVGSVCAEPRADGCGASWPEGVNARDSAWAAELDPIPPFGPQLPGESNRCRPRRRFAVIASCLLAVKPEVVVRVVA